MAAHLARDIRVIEIRHAETPPDLHAAYGIGIGVLLGVMAWAVIIAASVALISRF